MTNQNKERFIGIPDYVVADFSVPRYSLVLFGLIRTLAWTPGYCFANNSWLSRITGLSIEEIKHSLRIFESRGYVRIVKEFDDQGRVTARSIYVEATPENIQVPAFTNDYDC